MPKIEKIRKRHLLKKKEQKRTLQQIEDTIGSPITNLDENIYPPTKLKELYASRWGIETSF